MSAALLKSDAKSITSTIEALFGPEDVIELRALVSRPRKRTDAGYFDGAHRDELVSQAMRLNDKTGAQVYVTLNPLDPQCLARSANRVTEQIDKTATDANVSRRRWLLVDVDPQRPSGVGATDEQKALSLECAKKVANFLGNMGWPQPVTADSGNGFHLLYRVDLPNDAESRDLVKDVLEALANRFDDDAVKIDRSVFNAGRIVKLHGTVARKGDHTEHTPHRMSQLRKIPAKSGTVEPEELAALAFEARSKRTAAAAAPASGLPAPAGRREWSADDVETFLARGGVEIHGRDVHEGSDRWKLRTCPFNADHGPTESAVFRRQSGALVFKCLHNSCADNDWKALRALVDGPAEHRGRKPMNGPAPTAGQADVEKPKRSPKAAPPTLQPFDPSSPLITWEGGALPQVLKQAEHALLRQSEFARPYRRGADLVRLGRLAPADVAGGREGVHRQRDALTIITCTPDHLTVQLARAATWQKWDARSNDYKRINPPGEVSHFLIATADELDVPRLAGVIEAPTLRPDGSLLDLPGYDDATGIFYDPSGVTFPSIPDAPTQPDAISALTRISQYLRGFAFSDDEGTAGASRSVALAAVLTAVCRRSLPAAPLFAFDAPTAGSGKSLLADFVAIVATGRRAAVMSHTDDAAEERKRMFAILSGGDLVVAIDNIEKPLGSDVLCSVLTQPVYQDRVLGASKTVTVPTSSLFLATGNNLRIQGDLVRRVLTCRIDPRCARPDERRFDFDLKSDALRDRSRIVADALTVLRAFVLAGKPQPAGMYAFGGFEQWSDLVRASLVWAGEADPLVKRAAIENSDPERTALRAVFEQWHAAFGKRSMTAQTVLTETRSFTCPLPDLKEALELIPHRYEVDSRVLGNWLKKYTGRVEGGLRLASRGTWKNYVLWCIEPVEAPLAAGESGESGESPLRESKKLSDYDSTNRTTDSSYRAAGTDSLNSPDSPKGVISASSDVVFTTCDLEEPF